MAIPWSFWLFSFRRVRESPPHLLLTSPTRTQFSIGDRPEFRFLRKFLRTDSFQHSEYLFGLVAAHALFGAK
jgi:hypothetical protein